VDKTAGTGDSPSGTWSCPSVRPGERRHAARWRTGGLPVTGAARAGSPCVVGRVDGEAARGAAVSGRGWARVVGSTSLVRWCSPVWR